MLWLKSEQKMVDSVKKKVALLGCNNNNGSVLILTIVISVVLIILSSAMLSVVITENRHTSMSIRSLSAINVAEAGIEDAIWELAYNGGNFSAGAGWSGTDPKIKNSTFQTSSGDDVGVYAISVTDPSSVNPVVEATGYVPSQSSPKATRTVRVLLQKENNTLFSMAAFGVDEVGLDTGVKTDSYDSSVGPYVEASAGSQGHVGTNAVTTEVISLGGTATINGNAIVGPSGDPATAITACGPCVAGDRLAATEVYSLPSVSPPGGLTVQSDIALGTGGSTTISSSGQYSNIDLGKNSVIIVDADVTLYVTDTFHFDRDSELRITNGASVSIYLDGSLSLDRGSQMNNVSQDPSKFGIYGTDSFVDPDPSVQEGGIDIDRNSTFYGTIYTPNATIDIDREGQIFGAVVGKKIQLDSSSAIHFDEALLNSGGGSGSTYSIVYWQEK